MVLLSRDGHRRLRVFLMRISITPPGDFKPLLGDAFPAFIRLVGYIRVHYVMDEIWNGTNALRFKKSGKSLVALELHERKFKALVIYGKAEREIFEQQRGEFSPYTNPH
jgi:hypothetical protein